MDEKKLIEEFIELKTVVREFHNGTQVYRSDLCKKLEGLRLGQEGMKDDIMNMRANCLARPPQCVTIIDDKIRMAHKETIGQIRLILGWIIGLPTFVVALLGAINLIKNIVK